MAARTLRVTGLVVAAALAGAGLAPSPARAAGEVPAWFEELTLNGFVSTSWSYNANTPDSRTNQFRVFDFDDNSFKLDVLELVAQLPVSKPRDAGFRADLELGSSIPPVSAAAGLFRDASGTAESVDLQQAYASWIAPVGSGLRFDVGKFVSPLGAEVIDGYDGWNDNATRSFLFGYAIPYTHTGVHASYAFSPRVSATAMVVNGWDVAVDNNRSKSVGAQLVLAPVPALTLWLNGMTGPERADSESDSRTMFEAVAVWKATSRLTLTVDAGQGSEPHAALDGGDATWTCIAGYARISFPGNFALSVRGESFDDSDGARTGVAQTLTEFTVTPEVRLTKRALVRADFRTDHSDHDVFGKMAGVTGTQQTLLVNVLFSF